MDSFPLPAPEEKMHGLLKHQIKQYFGDYRSIPIELQSFINAVNQSYGQFENEYGTLEQILQLNADELLAANLKMQAMLSSMEVEVRGRTAELETSNANLKREVVERQRVEVAWHESEERYREVVENASSAILMFDRQGCITFWNRFAEKLFGYTRDEILGKPVVGSIVPEIETSGRNLRQLITAICQHPELYVSNINENITKNGDRIWISWTNSPILTRTGELNGVQCIGHDITAQVLAEQSLRQSEQKFRAIFAGAGIGIALSDLDGRILESNSAKQRMLGYTATELTGLHFTAYTHPDHSERDLQLYQELVAARSNHYQLEKRYIRKDGQNVWGRLTVSLICDREGQPQFTIRMMEDINEQKLAQENLKLREQAIAACSSGIVLVDPRLPDAPMIYVNPGFESISGYSAAEVLGKNCRFLQGEGTEQATIDKLRAAIRTGQHSQVVLRNYRKDGTLFWNELSISPIYDDLGQLTHYIGIQTDITERKQSELKLRERVQREELCNRLTNQIRNTLELDTILDTVVSEIYSILALDRCLFAWCLPDDEYPFWEVVKEAKHEDISSIIGHYSGEALGTLTRRTINMEIVQIDDVLNITDQELQKTLLDSACTSALSIPIPSHADAVGAIWCHHNAAHAWTEAEIELLTAIADQLAIAIDQAELYGESRLSAANAQAQAQKLEQTNQELQSQIQERERIEAALRQQERRLRRQSLALAELAKTETFTHNSLNAALHEITVVAAQTLEVARTSVWLYAEERTKLRCFNLYERDLDRHSHGLELHATDFPAYFHALEQERGFAIFDAIYDPRTAEFADSYLKPLGITSMLESSIWLGGEMVGVLCNEHIGSQRYWALEEENFANSLADFIALIMEANERQRAELALRESEAQSREQATQLQLALNQLQSTQSQLIQTEKMSSLGQLVAGVAHEINNPVNFIYGNISHTSSYAKDLLHLLALYQERFPDPGDEIETQMEAIDFGFLVKDLPKMLSSMKVGADRIRQIVLSLRNFSRLDEAEMKPVDIHEGIDSTLLILQHRLKARESFQAIEIIRNYGDLPPVECYAGQLNQVFMNILSNAIDALETYREQCLTQEIECRLPAITITTQLKHLSTDTPERDAVEIAIADNGMGITETVLEKLFDPFFTTKPVGGGTGLGLSISYQIVVERHGGKLKCVSELGQGARFIIEIPIYPKLND